MCWSHSYYEFMFTQFTAWVPVIAQFVRWNFWTQVVYFCLLLVFTQLLYFWQ